MTKSPCYNYLLYLKATLKVKIILIKLNCKAFRSSYFQVEIIFLSFLDKCGVNDTLEIIFCSFLTFVVSIPKLLDNADLNQCFLGLWLLTKSNKLRNSLSNPKIVLQTHLLGNADQYVLG